MIQIDMPMPKNCADCCFANADLVNGTITLFCMTPMGRKMYAPDLIGRRTRPEWCPLKEQDKDVKSWIKQIADNQLANAPADWQNENQKLYSKGIWDGLQIAFDIISERKRTK